MKIKVDMNTAKRENVATYDVESLDSYGNDWNGAQSLHSLRCQWGPTPQHILTHPKGNIILKVCNCFREQKCQKFPESFDKISNVVI